MSQETNRPSWVIEQSLNWRRFTCCGDQDLFPFKCHACGYALVLCYECETLYTDLHDLSARRFPAHDEYSCPQCGTDFDSDFMRSSRGRMTFQEWHDAGLDHLLIDRPFSELCEMLSGSAAQIAGFLRRGMRSTAGTRITEFRNLAESIAVHFHAAAYFRDEGYNVAQSQTLSAAMDWHSKIPDSNDQAYALLGITDATIP
ncbi:MAG: hypothetical protein HUJ26_11225 [Planctomycetaceae bacterium]|nr:hypothetical protein [Planctomycetaceae bacterium]